MSDAFLTHWNYSSKWSLFTAFGGHKGYTLRVWLVMEFWTWVTKFSFIFAKRWMGFKKMSVILQSVAISLTPLTWLIHTSVLPSNWNPGKIFALTVWLGQVCMVKKKSDFPPWGKMVVFVTEFVIFVKTSK